MAVESAAVYGAPATGKVENKGLKTNAIGYVSNIVIGVASTAPAYSLAATLGFIVADKGVGTHAPAVLLASFVPMLLISLGYKYLNKADPDSGTTFAWTTRAFGPTFGWLNGWAIFLADLLVMASLGYIAATYTYLLFEWHYGETHVWVALVGCVLWIWLMTWICHRGIELSARIQQVLLGFEFVMLMIFAIVALVDVYSGTAAAHSIKPEADWFNPFAMNFGDLVVAMLLGIFIYWGWDSGVAVNEESEDANEGPGRAAVVSTFMLVAIYLLVSAGAQAYHGTALHLERRKRQRRAARAGQRRARSRRREVPDHRGADLGGRLHADDDPADRAHDAVDGQVGRDPRGDRQNPPALPDPDGVDLGLRHPVGRDRGSVDPDLGNRARTLGCRARDPGLLLLRLDGLRVALVLPARSIHSARKFIFVGLLPLLGGLIMYAIGIKAIIFYGQKVNSEGKEYLGLTLPIWFGGIGMVVGLILAWISRPYFRAVLLAQDRNRDPGSARRSRGAGAAAPDGLRTRHPRGRLADPRGRRRHLVRGRREHSGRAPGRPRRQAALGHRLSTAPGGRTARCAGLSPPRPA